MALLTSKYAVITGATSGIGKQIALSFAKEGATIYCLGIVPEQVEIFKKELAGQPIENQFRFHLCDVSKAEDMKNTFQKILSEFPRIDILVNNAGITKDNLLMRMSEADINAVLDINLKSCFLTCQEVIRPMMKQRSGRIINISSIVGMNGNAGQTNYSASKAGMIGFSKSLAQELGSRNILVNCIAPGFIMTPMTQKAGSHVQEQAEKGIPLGRLGTPEDIANCAIFLASDLSSYVTGQVLVVDGGLTLGI